MTTATDDPTANTVDTNPPGQVALSLPGLAGMAFAASVLAQNIWSAAAGVLPDPDASPAQVVEGFVDAGAGPGVLVGWVATNLVLLAIFVSGAYARLRRSDPLWAGVGLLGGTGLALVFAVLQVPIVCLAVGGAGLAGSPELVGVLWSAHNALFAFAGVMLGLALAGFSRSAGRAGLVPRWLSVLGPIGAAVMVIASIPVQLQAEGEPALMVGLVGFLVWLVFLVVFGNRLRSESLSAEG